MTLAEEVSAVDPFQEQAETSLQSTNDSLSKWRTKAWEQFLNLGLPSRKTENFRYILKLKKLYEKSLPLAPVALAEGLEIYPECQDSCLVFVNGRYSKELSKVEGLPSKVVIADLESAQRPYGAFLSKHWTSSLTEELDPFAMLNASLHQEGVLIYVPAKTIVDKPLQILHVLTGEKPSMTHPRIQIFMGQESEMCVVQRCVQKNAGVDFFCNQFVDAQLEPCSRLYLQEVKDPTLQNGTTFSALRARLKRDAFLDSTRFGLGASLERDDYHIVLEGENANAQLHNAWLMDEKRETHSNVLIEHKAPHCESKQLFKGANDGMSRSSFMGKIYVHQAAQKTDAFQLNNNLLLDDAAHADSKPNLEIFADDVKASHGATVGRINQEQELYLMTRGCSKEDAKRMLVHGYLDEVVDFFRVDSQKADTVALIEKELG